MATRTDAPRWHLSPRRYRSVCVVALALLGIIVVSGAAVRLTGSGLGCDDWPNCNSERLIDVSSQHAAIEQINRLFTGLVAVGVIVAVLGSLVRVPRRRDLTWLSVGLVAGVLAQIVLGGITVLVDLHPIAVQGHLLVSMALVANAVVLVRRAGQDDSAREVRVTPRIRRHVWLALLATAVALVAGTIVTGAGPHAGDEEARRFDIAISRAAQIHGVAVWVAVAVVATLMYRLRTRRAERQVLDGPLVGWIAVALAQAGVGYLQYFSGVPAVLVGLHVALATTLWGITVWLAESMWTTAEAWTTEDKDASARESSDELGALVDRA
jgi:heme a synthase